MDYTPEMKRLMKAIENGESLIARTTINNMLKQIDKKVRYLKQVKEKRTGTLRAVYETDYHQALKDQAELKKCANNIRGLINKKNPDRKLGRVIVSINNMNDIKLKNSVKHNNNWRYDRAKDRVEARMTNLIFKNFDYNLSQEDMNELDEKAKELGMRPLSDYLYEFFNNEEPINSGDTQEALFIVLDEYYKLYNDIKGCNNLGLNTDEKEKRLQKCEEYIKELRERID